MCEHTFVSSFASHDRGGLDAGSAGGAGGVASRRAAAVGLAPALGWSCPGCAVENPRLEYGADGEDVECDYCGRAFALSDSRSP